jgi:phosphoglycolate phosphatase
MARYPHILFDLDGTLIDSAPAILASFRDAFAQTGIAPARSIDESIIGPPLLETLQLLSAARTRPSSAASPTPSRPATTAKATRPPPPTPASAPCSPAWRCRPDLSIATNKRIHPTRLILEHLGWHTHFAHIYALDLFSPRLPDKAAMIGRLLADQAILTDKAIYIGDRSEDGESADANGLPFIAVTWGYGSIQPAEMAAHWRHAASPEALGRALLAE